MRVGLPSHAAPERGGAHWKNKQTTDSFASSFSHLSSNHIWEVFFPPRLFSWDGQQQQRKDFDDLLAGRNSFERLRTLWIYLPNLRRREGRVE